MKTVGQLLKSARLRSSYTIQEIEKFTKIRSRYLESLESDDYQKLPSGAYAKGFIKNYASFLGLSADSLLAVFRRDFTENEQGQIVPRSLVNKISSPRLIWTPRVTVVVLVSTVVTLFLGFVVYQYQGFYKPKIQVIVPNEGEIVLGPVVTVSGIADPSDAVSVNGQLVVVEPEGDFSTNLNLPQGQAKILVETTNSQGYSNQVVRGIEVRIEN